MKKTITTVLMLTIVAFSACTDKKGAKKALERSGYKVITVGGYDFTTESEDTYQTRFKAVALNGDTVTGTVSKGTFGKGSTIRLDD